MCRPKTDTGKGDNMKIAGYAVTDITARSAKVGCASITLAEARALVAEMELAKSFVMDGYTSAAKLLSDKFYANFRMESEDGGFVSVGGGSWRCQTAEFCLNRDRAKELLNFLQDYFNRFPSRS